MTPQFGRLGARYLDLRDLVLENTIHLIVGLARAKKALIQYLTGTSLGAFLHTN